jgi:competence CoiA-like predicted nuclease
MLFAIVNGEKVEAKPKLAGICPLCHRDVISKCGETNIWHWAHNKEVHCDSWHEPETEWHKKWKLVFGKDNCEIAISQDGVKHIADIVTNNKVIIELQNSPIQKPIIRIRETFYGKKMIWVINGTHFKNNFVIKKSRLDEDDIYFQLNNPLSSHFGKIDNSRKNAFNFSWSKCRKSWKDVERNVFIDFGDEYLFWVKEGMGTSCGKGNQVSKRSFLVKYGGDIELLKTLINSSESDPEH